jgi:glutathione S-transferase
MSTHADGNALFYASGRATSSEISPRLTDKRCYNARPSQPTATIIMMKLIGSLTSPYVRKVRIVLAEKKIDYEFVVDNPWDAATEVPQHNPLGKVPVLLMEDGSPLIDSRVIVDYLDTVTPLSRLIPEANRQRLETKRWEALADGVTDAAVSALLESRRKPAEQSKSWSERQLGKVTLGLKALDTELGDKPWCTGNAYSLADIATGACLGFVSFRFPKIDWRKAHPGLEKLYEKLMQRQSFIDTEPKA